MLLFLTERILMITIRKADKLDFDGIWEIFRKVALGGDTYVFDPDISKEEAYSRWMAPYMATYVAVHEEKIVGTYIIKPNQEGLGSHVANGSYMVDSETRGLGIGYKLGEHSLIEAKKAGYKAMQYNMVVSSNKGAIALWEKLGFKIVGQLEKAFNHKELGYIDAYVMYRLLD